MTKIDDLTDDFELLDDWEERYKYLIELGRRLPEFPDAARTAENKVQGCVSQVWIISRLAERDGRTVLEFDGDSDAHIVRGLIAVLLMLYSGETPDHILAIDAHAVLARLGLNEHLTPQRSNGLASMIQRMRRDAAAVSENRAAS